MPGSTQIRYAFEDWLLDPQERLLVCKGQTIPLTPKVFDILVVLVEKAGSLVSKEEFMKRVWPDAFVEDAVLTQNIWQLRKVLGESAIETVPKKGYRFLKEVRTLGDTAGRPAGIDGKSNRSVGPNEPALPALNHASRWRSRRIVSAIILGVTVVLVSAVVATRSIRTSNLRKITDSDTVVLADFSNRSGDPAFDGSLQQALSIALAQSPLLNVVSEHKVRETLKLMGRQEEESVEGETALEVCQRTTSKAVLHGSITSIGSRYVLGLDARNCQTGDLLAAEQAQAARKEDVLDTLGSVSNRLRRKLGESLSSVQKFDVPLESATTPSLEALKAVSVGLKLRYTKGNADSIPFFKRAIDLDPNFALAYGYLSSVYQMEGEITLSREEAQKAYALREHVTEREKFALNTFFFNFVTGEREKAIDNCTLWVQSYPRDATPYICLFFTQENIGRYEQALPYGLECVRANPDAAPCYADLILTYRVLNRTDEGKSVYQQAITRGLQHPDLHVERYTIAFLERDTAEMARQLAALSGKEGEDAILNNQAHSETFFGRMAKARDLSRQAAEVATRSGQADRAAQWQLEGALADTLVGDEFRGRNVAAVALSLGSTQVSQRMAAIVLALSGDRIKAEKLSRDLLKDYPSDTMQLNYWKPLALAAVMMRANKPAAALEELRTMTAYEAGERVPFLSAYLRGESYLALHRGPDAVAAFQSIIDHQAQVANQMYGALARLGLARGYVLQGDRTRARAAYQDFLSLWKDADADIPILHQARAEYVRLR